MTDLDDRIRSLVDELVQSAPLPPPLPNAAGHTRASRQRILLIALMTALAVAAISGLWLGLGRHRAADVATSQSPRSASTENLSHVEQLFLNQLETGSVRYVTGDGVTASKVTVMQVKEVGWSELVDNSTVPNQLRVPDPVPDQIVYVEVAVGNFDVLGSNVPCAICRPADPSSIPAKYW